MKKLMLVAAMVQLIGCGVGYDESLEALGQQEEGLMSYTANEMPDPGALNDGNLRIFSTGANYVNCPDPSTLSGCSRVSSTAAALWNSAPTGWSSGFLAPSVRKIATSSYVLWFDGAISGSSGQKCIFRGKGSAPGGKYTMDNTAAACNADGSYTIDPYVVLANGTYWLYARRNNSSNVTGIFRRQLQGDGYTWASGSSMNEVALASATWEESSCAGRKVMENPALHQLSYGTTKRWFLFYSAGCFEDSSYKTGYHTCGTTATPTATCGTKTNWMNTGNSALSGPGGASFYSTSSDNYMVIHSWVGSARNAYLYKVSMKSDLTPDWTSL